MWTIYDLLYRMDNMNFNIIVQNDAFINDEDSGERFEGEVSDFKMTDLFDEIQEEEVTDLYTLADGRMVICYNNEEE
jgi:hypothetical protein